MAQIQVYYEPETELLTVFWQNSRKNQICTELDNEVILIKDSATDKPIGVEILSYRPKGNRLDSVGVEMGQMDFIQNSL
ncbi:MAG: hypothetical protein VKJ02_19450 [Snowella sp.]|nr:hypothetical protein [Snowella sp.]